MYLVLPRPDLLKSRRILETIFTICEEKKTFTYPEASDMESSVLALAELTKELARN